MADRRGAVWCDNEVDLNEIAKKERLNWLFLEPIQSTAAGRRRTSDILNADCARLPATVPCEFMPRAKSNKTAAILPLN